jgi:DNA-binding MarR family transcriptional regulator
LADRLRRLADAGMIVRSDDPTHKQRSFYSLTEKAIELLPILILIGAWGTKHLRVGKEYAFAATVLERGGPKLLRRFMAELRRDHLGSKGFSPSYNEDGRVNPVFEAALAHGRKTLRPLMKDRRPSHPAGGSR